jgi:F-type H+-transporting ATP synthase subunit e
MHDLDKEHHAIHEREKLVKEAKEAWKSKQERSKAGPEGGQFMVS